jgi:hypothetical protein
VFSNKVKRPLILLLALSVAGWVFAAEPEGETPSVNTAPLRGETMDAMSNRHVHPFNGQTVDGVFADTEGFSKVAQSDGAELWLNEAFGTVRIKNLKTGYIWGALPAEANAEGLNKTWTSYGNSIAAIECYDEAGVERRYGLSESAQTTFTMTDGGFICHANFSELGISFDTRVALQENKLTFSIPEESITEGTDGKTFTLKSVSFLPYLGAVYGDTMDGYLLIPDGPGALIRFRKPANYSSTYDKKIYGFDLGIESLAVPSDIKAFRPNDYAVDERQIVMPVYGIVHGAGQNGLLMVVEDGDLYASITATPAISNNPYNRVTARFEYRQKYSKNINRKEGAGVFTPQEHRNELSPSLSVYILDGNSAHYDGMAVLYRERLQNEGILTSVEPQSSIPLRLEVLGADKKRQFFKTSTEIFTDVDRAEAIVSSLAADGVTNLSLVYRCFSKNNEAGQPILNCVGTAAGFAGLADRLNAQGGRFSLYLDPLSANADQITLRTEAANTLSNMVIKQPPSAQGGNHRHPLPGTRGFAGDGRTPPREGERG